MYVTHAFVLTGPFVHSPFPSSTQVLSIYDLNKAESIHALTRMRKSVREQQKGTRENIMEAVSIVGGRLLYLNKVSKARDMAEMARHMLSVEKAWLLSQIGLIPDCDDDVMDEVRFCFLRICLIFFWCEMD